MKSGEALSTDGVGQKLWLSRSEPEKIGLAPEPEPFHQLSHWSRVVSGPSRAVTTLIVTQHRCQGCVFGKDLHLPLDTRCLDLAWIKYL